MPTAPGCCDFVFRECNRSQGTVPLAPREGDGSMFSANRLPAKCVFRPENGPVPSLLLRSIDCGDSQGAEEFVFGQQFEREHACVGRGQRRNRNDCLDRIQRVFRGDLE